MCLLYCSLFVISPRFLWIYLLLQRSFANLSYHSKEMSHERFENTVLLYCNPSSACEIVISGYIINCLFSDHSMFKISRKSSNRKSAVENLCYIVFVRLCSLDSMLLHLILYLSVCKIGLGTMSSEPKLNFSRWIAVNAMKDEQQNDDQLPADNSNLPAASLGSALNLICNDFLTFI